ncbi:MAG: hypothetical protein SGCHY_005484 [Lobulomycetales sp.]
MKLALFFALIVAAASAFALDKRAQAAQDKYALDRGKGSLGSGWAAFVKAAHRVDDDTPVALKIPKRETGWWDDNEFHLLKEFKESPNVLNLLDSYEVEEWDKGHFNRKRILVLPRAHESLEDFIGQRRAIPMKTFVKIMLDTAKGIKQMHSKNICHRDLRPGNVLIMRDPTENVDSSEPLATIADLGIAEGAPGSQAIEGDVSYMSPEYAKLGVQGFTSSQIDCLDGDVWSLGTLFYQLISRKLPFSFSGSLAKQENDVHTEVMMEISSDKPAPPIRKPVFGADRYMQGDIPNDLKELIAKMLEKDISKRMKKVGDVVGALDAIYSEL